MPSSVIEASNLGKRYRLGEDFQYDTVRDAIARLRAPRSRSGEPARERWVFRDVSFTVGQGEVVGVVGANGSGKTTLLKLVARITEPTEGIVRTRGRVGSLLDVGTGFHPELTGAENIEFGAAVLGMSRRLVRSRMDDIVEFAGIGPFLETPIKRYSNGMRLRLAFAVAAFLEPEILAVDEVLAVGDIEFQRRCLQRISELPSEGRTVLFVSHDHRAVTSLCDRAIWLDGGEVKADGPASIVVSDYLTSRGSSEGRAELTSPDGVPAVISAVALMDRDGQEVNAVSRGEPLRVRLTIRCMREVPGLDIAVYAVAERGTRILDEAWLDQPDPPRIPAGATELMFSMPGILAPGRYVLGVWIGDSADTFQESDALSFDVIPLPGDRTDPRPRVMQTRVQWSSGPVEGEQGRQ